MTYGIIRVRSRIPADGKGRAKDFIWNPRTNDWNPLELGKYVVIEKRGWPVMGKFWFEDGDKWYVAERWFALPMRIIEELGLSNYVLETMERRPRWQVILE